MDTFYGESDLAKTLGLGKFGPINGARGGEIIDVEARSEVERRLPGDSDRKR